jgi:CBS domain-containing protein
MTESIESRLTAADVMTTGLRTCSPFSSVAEASLILRGVDCGAIPVVDAGEAIGVLTDRDIALAVADHPDIASLPVSEIMSKNPITVSPSATIAEIQAKLIEYGVKRVLVVDQTGQLQGLIAKVDLAPSGAEPPRSS